MPDTDEFQAAAAEARTKPIPLPPFHGESFHGRVPGGLAFLEYLAAGDLDTDSPDPAEIVEANRAVLGFLRALVDGDAEWRRFRRVCQRHQVSLSELGALIRTWTEAVVARPTGAQLSSAGEPSPSGASSRDAAPATAE